MKHRATQSSRKPAWNHSQWLRWHTDSAQHSWHLMILNSKSFLPAVGPRTKEFVSPTGGTLRIPRIIKNFQTKRTNLWTPGCPHVLRTPDTQPYCRWFMGWSLSIMYSAKHHWPLWVNDRLTITSNHHGTTINRYWTIINRSWNHC